METPVARYCGFSGDFSCGLDAMSFIWNCVSRTTEKRREREREREKETKIRRGPKEEEGREGCTLFLQWSQVICLTRNILILWKGSHRYIPFKLQNVTKNWDY